MQAKVAYLRLKENGCCRGNEKGHIVIARRLETAFTILQASRRWMIYVYAESFHKEAMGEKVWYNLPNSS